MFALANVGVPLSATSIAAAAGSAVAWAILIARVGGKIAGIWGGAPVASKLGLVDLPPGVGSMHLAGMAAAGGTGFTVSLFVAEVAFGRDSPLAGAREDLVAGGVGRLRDRRTPSLAAGGEGIGRGRASGPATEPT